MAAQSDTFEPGFNDNSSGVVDSIRFENQPSGDSSERSKWGQDALN
jgi:hypothetical protein